MASGILYCEGWDGDLIGDILALLRRNFGYVNRMDVELDYVMAEKQVM